MGFLRRLASQSAVYGLSSVVPRLLNYFLVVLHSRVYDKGEYGVLTELYAYIAILMVVLTFGLETGFFRFARTDDPKTGRYSTSSPPLAPCFLPYAGAFAPPSPRRSATKGVSRCY